MKKLIAVVGCAALLVGCASHERGGMGNESGTTSGSYDGSYTNYNNPNNPAPANSSEQYVPPSGGSSQSATGDTTGRHP